MFSYEHRVQFYETDLMGIIHHSNYLRIFEEARVAWAHAHGILHYQDPASASHLAVYGTEVRHLRPGRFGDVVRVEVQARLHKVRIFFEYKMWRDEVLLCECRTVHVPLDLKMNVIKPPVEFKKVLEKQTWIETWLSSLSA
jgi:acyl-CoA thioester hydrolase